MTELARVEPPPFPGESLTLTTEMLVRGDGQAKVPTVALPVRGSSVQLLLDLSKDGHERRTYVAAVRTAEDEEPVFTQENIRSTKGTGGPVVILHVPSKFIKLGDYTVKLYKRCTDVTGEAIYSYAFRAR